MPATTHPFRAAVEARDLDAMAATLAEDVVFHSPVAFTPFEGREDVSELLRGVMATFEDFTYTDELAEGDTTALVFRARVGDKAVQGLDLVRHDEAGQIREFTVMVRPASALMALAEAMGPVATRIKER